MNGEPLYVRESDGFDIACAQCVTEDGGAFVPMSDEEAAEHRRSIIEDCSVGDEFCLLCGNKSLPLFRSAARAARQRPSNVGALSNN